MLGQLWSSSAVLALGIVLVVVACSPPVGRGPTQTTLTFRVLRPPPPQAPPPGWRPFCGSGSMQLGQPRRPRPPELGRPGDPLPTGVESPPAGWPESLFDDEPGDDKGKGAVTHPACLDAPFFTCATVIAGWREK